MGWPSEQNKAAQQPTATAKEDGYAEAFTGAGTSKERSVFATIASVTLLTEDEVCNMYLGDGFARRIVDSVAEEMTRAGIEIEDVDESLQQEIQSKLEELDVMKNFNETLRWSRGFGGAVIVIGVNDGGALDVPLNEKGVKDVEFIRVYDRYHATIEKRVLDTYSMDYGKPEMWLITPAEGGNPYRVHYSRVIVIDGEPIPQRHRQANQGWGASVLQHCRDALVRLGMSHQWANAILERNQQAVQKIPGLAQLLQKPNGKKQVADRVDAVDMVRGILNTIVIDAQEDYTIQTQTLTGVCDILDRFAQFVSGITGIPMFVLMGQGKGGLNNTGAAELEAWYARIEAMQNDILRKPLDRIISLILRSKGKGDGGNYTLKFCPLYVPSEKEQAETEKIKAETKKAEAETASKYVDMGALDPNEVRQGLTEQYEHIDLSFDPHQEQLEREEAALEAEAAAAEAAQAEKDKNKNPVKQDA